MLNDTTYFDKVNEILFVQPLKLKLLVISSSDGLNNQASLKGIFPVNMSLFVKLVAS